MDADNLLKRDRLQENIISWLPLKSTDYVLKIGKQSDVVEEALRKRVSLVELCDSTSQLEAVGAAQYDYVILWDALEYAGDFVTGCEAQKELLQRAYSLIREDGTLVVAVDNCFGLKYWAGSADRVSEEYYGSLENDSLSKRRGLLSKAQMTKLLELLSCKEITTYYPYPDYKKALMIYSDDYLPKKGELTHNFHNFDGLRLAMFDENQVYNQLIEDEVFPIFSNSFLYIIR